jgi:hypothetical protein
MVTKMRAPLLSDMKQIRKRCESLVEAEREELKMGSQPGSGRGQGQTAEDLLSFPPIMAGVAGDFAEIYSSVLEPPKHFFYMTFLTCLGSMLSDRIKFDSELSTQVRLYTLLLGESADDRKSTVINKTVNLFSEVFEDFRVCWGVGSAEGLQKLLQVADHLLLCLDEFKTLVSKCKIDSAVLLPCITTLFESNRYESHTKKLAVKLENAHLSVLAASTIETFEQTWDSTFSDIGFGNRLFVVPGGGKRRFAFPRQIPIEEKVVVKSGLREIFDYIGARIVLGITPEAHELYENWYLNLERSLHSKRLDGYCLRFMGLLAVNEFQREITPEIVNKAITLMDWQLKVRKRHDPIDADNLTAKMEEKIRRVLAEGPRSDRELKQRTHANRSGLWIYEHAKRSLIGAEEITFDKKTKMLKRV